MIAALLLIATSLLSSELQALTCTFTPPTGWEEVSATLLSPRVKAAYLQKAKNSFSPSLNLAIEENIESTLEEYLTCIKNRYEKEQKSLWRDLGPFETRAGTARLTSIDIRTKQGDARLLQLILLRNHTAYVLTAAVAKEEFSKLQKTLDAVFCSLNLTDNLVESRETATKQK
ncbi:MAG: hypothetical protein ACHQT8_06185 [Chlamydiales bacterium]